MNCMYMNCMKAYKEFKRTFFKIVEFDPQLKVENFEE